MNNDYPSEYQEASLAAHLVVGLALAAMVWLLTSITVGIWYEVKANTNLARSLTSSTARSPTNSTISKKKQVTASSKAASSEDTDDENSCAIRQGSVGCLRLTRPSDLMNIDPFKNTFSINPF